MLHSIKKRLEERALVAALVLPLALCVFAFLSVASYFAFRKILPPDLAALATAGCGLLLIVLILAGSRLIQASHSPASSRREAGYRHGKAGIGDELEDYLGSHMDSALGDWVRDNPGKASMASFAVGIAAGYSKQFLRILTDLQADHPEPGSKRRPSGK